MNVTVKDLMDFEIFEEYKILTSSASLNKIVESASFIEVKNYKEYIVPNSIIITTLAALDYDTKLLSEFIIDSRSANIAAIIIKDKEELKEISSETINLANRLDIPLIILNYDCNLSTIMNQISHVLYSNELLYTKENITFVSKMSNVFSFEKLIEIIKEIDLFNIYISFNSNTYYSSSETLTKFIQSKPKNNSRIFKKTKNSLITKNNVFHNDEVFCTYYMQVDLKNHLSGFHYSEYITFIIMFLKNYNDRELKFGQKKLEDHINSLENKNSKQLYSFPLCMLFFQYNEGTILESIDQNEIKNCIHKYFNVASNKIFMYPTPRHLVILADTSNSNNLANDFYELYANCFPKLKDNFSAIYCSKNISSMSELETLYFEYSSIISFFSKTGFNKSNVWLDDYSTLSLIHNVSEDKLLSYMYDTLKSLCTPAKAQHDLIDTLEALIKTNFNLKKSADILFIHYNTLRYRINTLKKLGFDPGDFSFNTANISIAIIIYNFIYLAKYSKKVN